MLAANSECRLGPTLACRYPSFQNEVEIARILKEEGYINNFVIKRRSKKLVRIFLRYDARGLPRVLTWRACRGRDGGVCRLASDTACWAAWHQHRFDSRGLMSGKTARKENMGGEVLAEVY